MSLPAGTASTHGVDLRIHLEEQAPLLRGCPDRGGERPAKGGAHALRSNVWGDAQSASHPAPDKRKRAAIRQPFFFCLAERGGDRRGFSSPASEVSITTTTTCISRTLAKKKAAQWAAFFFIWRRGGDSQPLNPPKPLPHLTWRPRHPRKVSKEVSTIAVPCITGKPAPPTGRGERSRQPADDAALTTLLQSPLRTLRSISISTLWVS